MASTRVAKSSPAQIIANTFTWFPVSKAVGSKPATVKIRIGDLWIDPFFHEKGEKQVQPGARLKGRLLFIEWIKVDGVLE